MQGYTRASALGPIADFLDHRGGSIARVFERADLPLSLLDHPDYPLPLKDQFCILREAGREIGTPYFGAEIGQLVRMERLSAFGGWVSRGATLANAIDRSQRGLNRFLQTATVLEFRVEADRAFWSIEFLDRGSDGRFQNELLGVSYLIDGVRAYAGQSWSPSLIRSTCVGRAQAAQLEKIFRAPVYPDAPVSCIEFDAALLCATSQRVFANDFDAEPAIPSAFGYKESVAALSAIALLEGQPKIDWVAGKMGLSRRSLQRALEAEGARFKDVVDEMLKDRALSLVGHTDLSFTEIAFRLGYSEGAQFTRAFRRWTGVTPTRFKAQTRVAARANTTIVA